MALVAHRILLLVLLLLPLSACESGADKQWYKPGRDYTVAEFQRDQAECTKNRVLDEQCLKQHGWVPLSGDRYTPPPPPTTPRGRY